MSCTPRKINDAAYPQHLSLCVIELCDTVTQTASMLRLGQARCAHSTKESSSTSLPIHCVKATSVLIWFVSLWVIRNLTLRGYSVHQNHDSGHIWSVYEYAKLVSKSCVAL